jgi:hypothetical protein
MKINKLIENLFKEELTGKSGFYCCVRVKNLDEVSSFLRSRFDIDFETKYYPHATIISSNIVPNGAGFVNEEITATGFKFSILGNSLVILLNSEDLVMRHDLWVAAGCINTYDDYIPHVTIIDNIESPYGLSDKISSLLSKQFSLDFKFGKEVFDDNII